MSLYKTLEFYVVGLDKNCFCADLINKSIDYTTSIPLRANAVMQNLLQISGIYCEILGKMKQDEWPILHWFFLCVIIIIILQMKDVGLN